MQLALVLPTFKFNFNRSNSIVDAPVLSLVFCFTVFFYHLYWFGVYCICIRTVNETRHFCYNVLSYLSF